MSAPDPNSQAPRVEALAAKLAASDGLDWSEVCAYELDDVPDDGCGSGTCVAAHYEDHDPEVARGNYLKWARVALDESARLRASEPGGAKERTQAAVQISETLSKAGYDVPYFEIRSAIAALSTPEPVATGAVTEGEV